MKKIDNLNILSNKIREHIKNVTKEYFIIGEILSTIETSQAYKSKNYEDIYHYADVELKIDKSKTSRLISIFNKFGNDIDTYRVFTYSQLREMITLSDEDIKQCTFEMTVKEIATLKYKKYISTSEDKEVINDEKKIIQIDNKPDNSQIDKLNKEIEILQLQLQENKKVDNNEALEIEQLKKEVNQLKIKVKNSDSFFVYLKQELKNIESEQSKKLLADLDKYISTGKVPNKIKLLNAV